MSVQQFIKDNLLKNESNNVFENIAKAAQQVQEKNLTLNIWLTNGYEHITDIWIFNRDKSVEAEPSANINSSFRSYPLAPGEYYVRTEINGNIEDNRVQLSTNKTYSIGDSSGEYESLVIPKLYSSALLGGVALFETSHEYYTEPAKAISAANTLNVSDAINNKSGLFIFLRFPSKDTYKKNKPKTDYWNKFSLYNSIGELVCQFPEGAVTGSSDIKGDDPGYLGFSANIFPGLYFLKIKGKNRREIPIYVYKDWYTQFFMTVSDEPLFGSIRVFLSKTKAFDPQNKYHLLIDICLNKIQNQDYEIDQELLQNIAYGKFESPMLGLLGAYIYLKSNETKDDQLFRTIVHNLQNKILVNNYDAPDIWALNLLSYEHFNETFTAESRTSINGTPMLRIAYDTIKRAASKYRWLVPEGSLNDLIAEKQVFDSPFNTYLPVNEKIKEQNPSEMLFENIFIPQSLKRALDSGDLILPYKIIGTVFIDNNSKPERVLVGKSNSSKQDQYSALLEKPLKTGWIGCSIVTELMKDKNVSSEKIADRINIPINTVLRIRRKFKI